MKWVKDKEGYYRKQTIIELFKELSKTKRIIVIIALILAVYFSYAIFNATNMHFVQAKAEHYICKKYDIDKSELELVDYRHSGIYWSDKNIFYITPVWADFAFEYKHNDLKFNINRINGRFYDDYQLEEIEQFCTDWLKNNIDERIVGMELSSYSIIRFYQINNKSKYYIMTESDVQQLLESYDGTYDYDTINIFIEVDKIRETAEKNYSVAKEMFTKEQIKLENCFRSKFPNKDVWFSLLPKPFTKMKDSCKESWWIYSLNPYV